MTELIKIDIQECLCCLSESEIFVNYNCQHLVCINCHNKMKKQFNRETCLYCNPLNINSNNNLKQNINYKLSCNIYCCIISYMIILLCLLFFIMIYKSIKN
jgi:hypothetical protein